MERRLTLLSLWSVQMLRAEGDGYAVEGVGFAIGGGSSDIQREGTDINGGGSGCIDLNPISI